MCSAKQIAPVHGWPRARESWDGRYNPSAAESPRSRRMAAKSSCRFTLSNEPQAERLGESVTGRLKHCNGGLRGLQPSADRPASIGARPDPGRLAVSAVLVEPSWACALGGGRGGLPSPDQKSSFSPR